MNKIERELKARVGSLAGITPGVVIDVHRRGRRVAYLELGETYKYYDLASLTKILFTSSAAIHSFSRKLGELDKPIADVLPWWREKRITPRALLTHTAGLEWWLPMYKKLRGPMNPDARWAQMKKQLARVKPKRRTQSVYSDLDLWLFGAYLEAREERSLLKLWGANAERLGLDDIFFHPGNRPRFARKLYAPTEDYSWRGGVQRGEVHDENAWALAGVAPHAGLFGTAKAVSEWGLELRRGFRGESEKFGDTKALKHFVGRRVPRAVGDWGLGFMKPSIKRASAGRYFSKTSFGHTGFTGTSIWFDPKHDLLVVILSNRVHPTRENAKFVPLRPRIHNWIYESLF